MTRKLLLLAATAAALAAAPAAHAELAVGLQSTGASLTLFDTAAPGSGTTVVPVQGLGPGDTLDTIAFRPANGVLYGTTTAASGRRLYRIDITKSPAVATAVSATPFAASSFPGDAGAGFNPVVDRLRFVSDAALPANDDANFRVDPDAGNGAADTKVTIAGASANISGIGYTNLFAGSTSTTLYGIDTPASADARLVASAEPNNGTFTVIGSMSQRATPGQTDVGFSPATNAAFALLGQGAPMLFSLNANNGTVSNGQAIASPSLTEIAVVPSGLLGVPGSVAASEAARTVPITVARSRGSVGAVTVAYATRDATAKAGSDYSAQSGTLTFAAGETTKVVDVPIADDGVVEGKEAFTLVLSKATGGAVLDPGAATATVAIADSGAGAAVPLPPPTTGGTGAKPAGAPPTVKFGARTLTLSSVRTRGGITVTFTCTSLCQANGTMKLGSKTIGTGKRTFLSATGGTRTLRVKLSSAGLKALGRKKARTVKVTLAVADAAAQLTTRGASYKLTVPKKKTAKKG